MFGLDSDFIVQQNANFDGPGTQYYISMSRVIIFVKNFPDAESTSFSGADAVATKTAFAERLAAVLN